MRAFTLERTRTYLPMLLVPLLLLAALPASVRPASAASGRSEALYTPKDVMIQQWKTLCDAHPAWASYESIGKSIQGRDIWLFKIGNPNGGRVMYDGEGHGPEDGGTECLYKFCKWLLESDDPLADHVLRWNYHLIIPVLNVDTTSRLNMRRQYVLSNGTVLNVPYGVDLNRNGVYRWGESGSGDPTNSYSYRGLYGGSEPETKAYHDAVEKYDPALYCNTHVGGEYLMHYSNTELETNIKTLKADYAQQLGIPDPYPASQGGRGGFIMVDAYGACGTSGWLWEMSTWDNLKPTLDEWLEIYYPRALTVFLAFAKAVEKAPTPTETGIYDIFDAISLASAFMATPDKPHWNATVDFNGDQIVDIYDALILSHSFVISKEPAASSVALKRYVYATTQWTAQQFVSYSDAMQSHYDFSYASPNRLHSLRQDFTCLLYRNVKCVYSYSEEFTLFKNSGWLLKDSGGAYVRDTYYNPHYFIDIGNTGYQEWLANWYLNQATRLGYDAVYLDNGMYGNVGTWSYGASSEPINPRTGGQWTTSQMVDAFKNMYKAIRAKIGTRLIIANGIYTGERWMRWSQDKESYISLLSDLDGIMVEGWLSYWSSSWTYYPELNTRGVNYNWKDSIDMLVEINNLFSGKHIILSATLADNQDFYPYAKSPLNTTEEKEQYIMYNFASLLLAISPDNTFWFMPGWWGLANMQELLMSSLGSPSGNYTVSSGLYTREFDKFRVIVNPSSVTRNNVGPHTGIIELK